MYEERKITQFWKLAAAKLQPFFADTDTSSNDAVTNSSRTELNSRQKKVEQSFPAMEQWRETPSVGYEFDRHIATSSSSSIATQVSDSSSLGVTVCANHFPINMAMIPTLHFYHVQIKPSSASAGSAKTSDAPIPRVAIQLIDQLFRDIFVTAGSATVYAYDGRDTFVTTKSLQLKDTDDKNQPCFRAEVTEARPRGYSYQVVFYPKDVSKSEKVTRTDDVSGGSDAPALTEQFLYGLNLAALSFGRKELSMDKPQWQLVGQKIFSTQSELRSISSIYNVRRGYLANLKNIGSGLSLVSDLKINCCSATGTMPELMFKSSARYRSFDEMYADCCCRGGLHDRVLDRIEEAIKGLRVKSTHLGYWQKVKCLGPHANHPSTAFYYQDRMVTVEEYFHMKEMEVNSSYRRVQYPYLPTIDVGSATRQVLVPAEFLLVPSPQSPAQALYETLKKECNRYGVTKPVERMQRIMSDPFSVLKVLPNDPTAIAFGLDQVQQDPITVSARLLPPPKLQYGGSVVEPGLNGKWTITSPRVRFLQSPPDTLNDGSYLYGALVVAKKRPSDRWERQAVAFCSLFDNECKGCGIPLTRGGPPILCKSNQEQIREQIEMMKSHNVRIILVLMMVEDIYNTVKLISDKLVMPTQCVHWKKVVRIPSGFFDSLLPKINAKLGGLNHTIAPQLQRRPGIDSLGKRRMEEASPSASSTTIHERQIMPPPEQLSWLFKSPCMLVGIDVSHPAQGVESPSIAAVVGSIDRYANQYTVQLRSQRKNQEMVENLTDAMTNILTRFKSQEEQHRMPNTIVVYRDGVSEGQFGDVIQKELVSIKTAIALLGYEESTAKIAIIVCQKRHTTRIFVKTPEAQEGQAPAPITTGSAEELPQFINPCPGVVVRSTMQEPSITSPGFVEFYLNSHVTIQGTSKPCKYTLIYDEIGLKNCDAELLTYWSSYLNARCTKSVSYATPTYYAHWASRRGVSHLLAGGTEEDLKEVSNKWSDPVNASNMFFV